MKEHPILFNSEMVKAILDGRKSQTRRVIKPQPPKEYKFKGICEPLTDLGKKTVFTFERVKDPAFIQPECPYGKVGDKLWVRESHYINCNSFMKKTINGYYKADDTKFKNVRLNEREWTLYQERKNRLGNCTGRFMYKSLARIWLEITNIRVERVQDITEKDAIAEGLKEFFWDNEAAKTLHVAKDIAKGKRWWNHVIIKRGRKSSVWDCPRLAFRELWNDINAKRGFSWASNPFVWAIEFKKLEAGK